MLQAPGPSLLPSFLPLNPGMLCHLLEWAPAGTGHPTKWHPCTFPTWSSHRQAFLPSSAYHAALLHRAGLPTPSCHNPGMPRLHLSGSDSICTWADGHRKGTVSRGVHRGHHACFTSERGDAPDGEHGRGRAPTQKSDPLPFAAAVSAGTGDQSHSGSAHRYPDAGGQGSCSNHQYSHLSSS